MTAGRLWRDDQSFRYGLVRQATREQAKNVNFTTGETAGSLTTPANAMACGGKYGVAGLPVHLARLHIAS